MHKNRLLYLGLLFCALSVAMRPAPAQETSVRPGINDQFQKPDVAQFVERFEHEGREVYDQRERIVAACRLKPGMAVADIGAGTGLFTRLFAAQVGPEGKVYAVDIAKDFIDHITASCKELKYDNVVGVVCTQDSAKLPAQSIDVAFICDTYHHFEFPYKTMRSIREALRPGGYVVLVEFQRIEGQSSEFVMNHVRAGREVFQKEIETAGFELLDEADFLQTSYLVRFVPSERKTKAGHTLDSLDTVKKLVSDHTAVLVDVREESEWNQGTYATRC